MDLNFLMDNDSGYVSHFTESSLTMDSSMGANYPLTDRNHALLASDRSHFYVNEDTLLESPSLSCRHVADDLIIGNSQESVKTDFSGFDEDSDASFIVPKAKDIVYQRKACDVSTNSDMSLESPNNDSQIIENTFNTFSSSKSVKPSFLTEANKENIHPSMTPKKVYENPLNSDISPDLFTEEDCDNGKSTINNKNHRSPKKVVNSKELKMLKRVQINLSGVCPPPNVTIMQISHEEMLQKIEENKHLFCDANNEKSEQLGHKNCEWPEALKTTHHGLSYNKSRVSEDYERLCAKYGERYVGAETQSSCTVFDSHLTSPLTRKSARSRWTGTKSPGRRLSHLARRRITFSSSNLQSANSSAILGSRARQILVDAKKLSTLSKKKSPAKSPFKKRKTPSSSAKKKLALRFRAVSGELENVVPGTSNNSFKRALFQSPPNEIPSFSGIKRNLFKSSSSPDRKRKRLDSNDSSFSEDSIINPTKMLRSMSQDLRRPAKQCLNRTMSDSTLTVKTEELSSLHKKKLQLAVYEALCSHGVSHTHAQFKIYASTLARVTRKFLPLMKQEARTTEKMRRIARYHSYAVVKGRNVDEIVNDYLKNKMKNQKPQGYVGIGEESKNNSSTVSVNVKKEKVLQDRIDIINKSSEPVGEKPRFLSETRLDRIKKVISFEDS